LSCFPQSRALNNQGRDDPNSKADPYIRSELCIIDKHCCTGYSNSLK
jgi:hypothetical protein